MAHQSYPYISIRYGDFIKIQKNDDFLLKDKVISDFKSKIIVLSLDYIGKQKEIYYTDNGYHIPNDVQSLGRLIVVSSEPGAFKPRFEDFSSDKQLTPEDRIENVKSEKHRIFSLFENCTLDSPIWKEIEYWTKCARKFSIQYYLLLHFECMKEKENYFNCFLFLQFIKYGNFSQKEKCIRIISGIIKNIRFPLSALESNVESIEIYSNSINDNSTLSKWSLLKSSSLISKYSQFIDELKIELNNKGYTL